MTGVPDPLSLRAQAKHKDPTKYDFVRTKVVKVCKLDYIRPGKVISGTHFFSVDKGKTDIRMVYNGTSFGLNDILNAPHFGLPTVRETLRAILPGFHQCDLDVQDHFLNFILHKHMHEYSGVDVWKVQSMVQEDTEWELSWPGTWERWHRNWMGLRDSPYRSLQWQVRLKLEVYGDRRVLSNPFHWDHDKLNLPGSRGHQADLPWVMKIRAEEFLAAEIFMFVDDGRVVAHSPDLALRAACAYASRCAKLGVQDASRKQTLPSKMPGPCAGTVIRTDGGQVCGMVSLEKWEKTKLLIKELSMMLELRTSSPYIVCW